MSSCPGSNEASNETGDLRVCSQRRSLADGGGVFQCAGRSGEGARHVGGDGAWRSRPSSGGGGDARSRHRSEEHTSELQSQSNLVCRLLLEKKKYKKKYHYEALYHE